MKYGARRRLGVVGVLMIAEACSANGSQTSTTLADGAVLPSGPSGVVVIGGTGGERVPMTGVACSFDFTNNLLRSFQGRFCQAGVCTLLQARFTAGAGGSLTATQDGGSPVALGCDKATTLADSSTMPPTARVVLRDCASADRPLGDITIDGCTEP
ncbi:MAG: hypothetical protein JWM10_3717 [Myxococcaceae bacterium]|nr:hypothetical protein [Myxococcaceae bacterium]